MTQDENDRRLGWLSYTLDEGLRLGVFAPANLLTHATPEVLAEHLPRDLMVKVFASAFSTGKLTPEGILSVAPPTTMVRHVAPLILWTCVREAAHRHQIDAPATVPKGRTPVRSWIGNVIAAGLERSIFSPADVARHVPPRDWVRDVPIELVARMIAAGLTRPNFDPTLALEILTPAAIGEHVAPHLAWALIDEGAVRAFDLGEAGAGASTTSAAT